MQQVILEVAKSIKVNEIEYFFSDCDTPEKARNYLELLQYCLNREPGIIVSNG